MKYILSLLVALLCATPTYAATTLLPNGQQCFQTATGPVANGSINMYIPATTSPKTTWKDSGQVTANNVPIQLDANGCAIIYGVGSYRQQLYTGPVVLGVTTGNLVFDLVTTDTSAYNSVFWAGTALGTGNSIVLTDPGFNATDGTVINFIAAATNTGSVSVTINSISYQVLKDSTIGPASLTAGDIVAGNAFSLLFSASLNSFILLNAQVTQPASVAPLCGATAYTVVNDTGTPNTKLDVAAGAVEMVTATGQNIQRTSVAVTLDFGTVGANGLDTGAIGATTVYYIYLIDNGAGTAALASLSSTAPALPTGYTYVCRLSAAPTDGSSHLYSIQTVGNTTFVLASALTLTATTTGTCWTAFTAQSFAAGYIPSTAQQLLGAITISGTTGAGKAGVALGTTNANTVVLQLATTAVANQVIGSRFAVPNINAGSIYVCSSSNVPIFQIDGWVDNAAAN